MTRTVVDRGQAAILFVVVVSVIFVVSTTALAVLGGRVVERTRAQTAADAAALGSLEGGRPSAEALVERHGAELVSWVRGPVEGEVTVVVRLGESRATARATSVP
ncbi:MAG TPA: pilus assembly protein TadG-related protein [Ilumatobacteraceae bacterium]|nr:pilus assembly protein TadG-related protein [Ilumatobacteraceae bacterium]